MSIFNGEAHVNIDGREIIFPVNESVSHATLRTEDLTSAFESWLESVDPTGFKHLTERKERFFEEFPTTGEYDFLEEDWLNEELFYILNEYAPEGYYFGSHPGDGSDFGFWEDTDEV